MKDLWNSVKTKGFPYLKPGYVHQDPAENFFESMRSHGQRYTTPTSMQAEGLFKSLMVNNLASSYSNRSNCRDDNGMTLISLKVLNSAVNKGTEKSGTRLHKFNEPDHPVQTQQQSKSSLGFISRIQSAGRFARTIHSQMPVIKKCVECKNNFFCDDPRQNEYVSLLKSHKCDAIKIAAADPFERGFIQGVNSVNRQLSRSSWRPYLRYRFVRFLREHGKLDLEWVKCNEHRHPKKVSGY
ncbi:uncharacterized protein LOC117178988 [Belonocnema kinseyi]|uniref:uncharacterized protein LOC117178988 n=1 Tax=Belonocnema kinseyi TaxID=2817044 RepID=UPI00143D78F0|nr:uncharacterized protein LOC117178988 [Belonocnema kinseyi]